jgi:hypothetical protein
MPTRTQTQAVDIDGIFLAAVQPNPYRIALISNF